MTVRESVVGVSRPSNTEAASVAVAAVLGSFAFGVVMSLTIDNVLFTAIPGMYGLAGVSPTTGVFLGWAIHLFHGIVLGLVFGAFVTYAPKYGTIPRYGLAAGLVYGAVLWLALASFLMPFWVGITAPMDPPVPSWEPWSLVGHLFYGAYLGLVIPRYRRH